VGEAKIGVITAEIGAIMGKTGVIRVSQRLLKAEKLQSTPGTDNPHYAADQMLHDYSPGGGTFLHDMTLWPIS